MTIYQNLHDLHALAVKVGERLRNRGLLLTTAESCTGGWIGKTVTDVAGSSGWFDCGFVTYSNTAKVALLGVKKSTLVQHGAVSTEVVSEMALGALVRSQAKISVAVSGIAGPDGGTPEKPVGTVYFAWAQQDAVKTARQQFEGDRDAVRLATVATALQGILDVLA